LRTQLYADLERSFAQKDFVELLKIDKGNSSRNINKLVDKDYLEHVAKDSKKHQLSTQGKLLKKEIMTTFNSLHQSMTSGISHNELEQSVLTLSKISKNLEVL